MKTVTFNERSVRIAAWVVVVLAILGGGARLAKFLKETGPEAVPAEPEVIVPRVEVVEVEKSDVPIALVAQGDVEAVRRTRIVSQVGGRVIEVSPRLEAGETFADQELLLQIDPTDYRAALANAEAAVKDAELALSLEEASAEKALRDWEKLGNGREAPPLVRREPQLASARARVEAAVAARDKALADLDRTRVVAPYPCRIESAMVELGTSVTPGTPLADVLSLGAMEVRLPLSLEDYGFLARDAEGRVTGEVTATAKIGGKQRRWTGVVVRSEEIVDRATRSINVAVRFEGEEVPPTGLFVNAEVTGRTLADRVVLPRAAMLDARRLLVVNGEGELAFREVQVERTERDTVIIEGGLEEGERVVLTPLSTPVSGMKVEVIDELTEQPAEEEPTL